MPILVVEIVTGAGEPPDPGLSAALADAAGLVFGTPPGETWVRLRRLPAQDYAENGGGPPAGVRPVFVTVLKRGRPPRAAMVAEAARLTEAVARACGRPPGNVHIVYEPAGQRRVAFGGELVG